MFTCSACLRRDLLTLAPKTHPLPSALVLALRHRLRSTKSTRSYLPRAIRTHATLQSISKGHHRRDLVEALGESAKREAQGKRPARLTKRRRSTAVTKVDVRDALAKEQNKGHLDTGLAKEDKEARWLVETHLQDPLKLANAVLQRLRDGDLLAALQLVRFSEGKGEELGVANVVSWNHLIDYCMSQKDTRSALRIYNEMKKRGHKPDAHTYTILLRGFSQNTKRPNAVKDAVGVYNSIFAANSAVKPNTIHTNAVINACARGGDMDSLWQVAGRLPERGPGAPDKWTFTTILNAIAEDARRRAAALLMKDLSGDDAAREKVFEQAIQDGRNLWRDVITRWHKADLIVDESLVCAMGRLLLLSPEKRDWEDIFALVGQTMNVYRPQAAGQRPHMESGAESSHSASSAANNNLVALSRQQAQSTGNPVPANRDVTQSVYAVPGNNTLSMLIEASTLARQTHVGKAYWDVLTSANGLFRVMPDVQNITAYLRLLRVSRASKAALELLRQSWPESVQKNLYRRGTFVIAMSTCVRDKNNPNVFNTASSIVDLMQDKLDLYEEDDVEPYEEPDFRKRRDMERERKQTGQAMSADPKVLAMYLSLAMVTTPGVSHEMPLRVDDRGRTNFELDRRNNNTMRALARLNPDVINVKRLIKLRAAQEDFESRPKEVRDKITSRPGFVDTQRVVEKMEDMTALLKNLISAYDRIIYVNDKLEDMRQRTLDSEYIKECGYQKRKIASFLGRMDNPHSDQKKSVRGSGLWEGYDPIAQKNKAAEAEAEKDDESEWEDEDEEDDGDDYDEKTPGKAKFEAANRRARAARMKQLESNPLSRRQLRDREKERREDRIRKQFPPSMLKPSARERAYKAREEGRQPQQKPSDLIQKGWGGGFQQMAKEMEHGESGLKELNG